jgi:hypothetical protein
MTKIKEKIEKHSLWLQTAIIIVSLGYIYWICSIYMYCQLSAVTSYLILHYISS